MKLRKTVPWYMRGLPLWAEAWPRVLCGEAAWRNPRRDGLWALRFPAA